MGFEVNRGFDTPLYEEATESEKKLIIIAFEGAKTEPRYFSYIKDNLPLKALIKIEILKRDEKNTNSSVPTTVVNTITNLFEDENRLEDIKSKYDGFDDCHDIFWIVVDREVQESKKTNLLKAIESCKENYINIALTNPAFEFWLLLHFDINEYDESDLLENKKTTKKGKRFLEKELSKKIDRYDKANFSTEFITLKNISLALRQEKLFENELEEIVNNLGSNVGTLIEEILDLE